MTWITAPALALMLREMLDAGDTDGAIRWVTEAVSNLAAANPKHVPREVIVRPGSTGDARWDTLLATSFAYAMQVNGGRPAPWMLNATPLAVDWAWGRDGASNELIELIRGETPAVFRSKGILTRPRDWETW